MELRISGLRYELLHITMILRVPLLAWSLGVPWTERAEGGASSSGI